MDMEMRIYVKEESIDFGAGNIQINRPSWLVVRDQDFSKPKSPFSFSLATPLSEASFNILRDSGFGLEFIESLEAKPMVFTSFLASRTEHTVLQKVKEGYRNKGTNTTDLKSIQLITESGSTLNLSNDIQVPKEFELLETCVSGFLGYFQVKPLKVCSGYLQPFWA